VIPARLPLLLVVAGPTGSGKSDLAMDLAERFEGEIVNCDSVQIYRGMDIGTAKTPPEERRGLPHHLFDIRDPVEVFNAGDYASLAREILREIAGRGHTPVVVGGTGFYLRALVDGLTEGPKRDDALRARLSGREMRRPGSLHRLLLRLDPPTAGRIHAKDVNKIIRALEICLLEKRPASALFEQGAEPLEGFEIVKLVLEPERALLHRRIEERTKRMFSRGLLEELEQLLAHGTPRDAKALESIGYKQALELLDGRLTLPEAIERTTIATRQYAKRQITWFRREAGCHWLAGPGEAPPTLALALAAISAQID